MACVVCKQDLRREEGKTIYLPSTHEFVAPSGDYPDPVIFNLPDPDLDPTPNYLLIGKIAYISSKYLSISEISK